MNSKEVAKFLSGLVTGDLLVGLWLWSAGDLPMNFLGIRITNSFVPWWMAIDAILIILLVNYAWLQKESKRK